MEEIWREIVGFGHKYKISNLGRVLSSARKEEKILKLKLSNKGYFSINIRYGKRKYTLSIHRLIANAFIDNPSNMPTVNHIDGIKTNNNISNLEWATYSDQQKHAYKIGLRNENGENNHRHKLTEVEVKEIIELGKYDTYIAIGKKYGVKGEAIYKILSSCGWDHLDKRNMAPKRYPDRKLTVEIINEIIKNGRYAPTKEIAKKYSVSASLINRLLRGIIPKRFVGQAGGIRWQQENLK